MSQTEYLEMRGKQLLIDGIVIAEVTHLDDAIAISDRVSKYVASLEQQNANLLNKLRLANAKLNNYLDDDGNEFCITTGEYKGDCSCPDCWPEGHEDEAD